MYEFASRIPQLIDTLVEQGWVVIDDFLSSDAVVALSASAAQQRDEGDFHAAGVGRAERHAINKTVRGDDVHWLEPDTLRPSEQLYWARIQQLQAALNESLFLGIREGEFHYAHYPVGAFYQRHKDRFRDDNARIVSAVCYLNPSWSHADGGALRLWLDEEGKGEYQDISPKGGRLVLFMSDRFWHAVLPAQQPRWSLTGWFRR